MYGLWEKISPALFDEFSLGFPYYIFQMCFHILSKADFIANEIDKS